MGYTVARRNVGIMVAVRIQMENETLKKAKEYRKYWQHFIRKQHQWSARGCGGRAMATQLAQSIHPTPTTTDKSITATFILQAV